MSSAFPEISKLPGKGVKTMTVPIPRKGHSSIGLIGSFVIEVRESQKYPGYYYCAVYETRSHIIDFMRKPVNPDYAGIVIEAQLHHKIDFAQISWSENEDRVLLGVDDETSQYRELPDGRFTYAPEWVERLERVYHRAGSGI
jgi:hypothetical protein